MSARPYHTLAVVPDEPALPEHAGPRVECPACGARARSGDGHPPIAQPGQRANEGDPYIWKPVACCAERPVVLRRGGWFKKDIVCGRKDPHLHQTCGICGARWTTGFRTEGTGA